MVQQLAKDLGSGQDRLLLALLAQEQIATHPTASIDVYTLLAALVRCDKSPFAKSLVSADICSAIDASAECETHQTAQACSQFLVALARIPAVHEHMLSDRALGCVFALHDRSDDAEDRAAVIQADICLVLALLLSSPALPVRWQVCSHELRRAARSDISRVRVAGCG